jgi:hypothetical protein
VGSLPFQWRAELATGELILAADGLQHWTAGSAIEEKMPVAVPVAAADGELPTGTGLAAGWHQVVGQTRW